MAAAVVLTIAPLVATAVLTYLSTSQPKFNFKDKVILITGAGSGIGEALATALHKEGSIVILAARQVEKLEKVKARLDESQKADSGDSRVAVIHLDLSDLQSVESCAQKAVNLFGHIDVLVNNAGIGCRGAVENTSVDTYRHVLDVNVVGQIAMVKELLQGMLDRGEGTIIGIGSLQGKFTLPLGSAYGASKHAMQGFYDSLRMEVEGGGLRVLVVNPSYVQGEFGVNTLTGYGKAIGVESADHKSASLNPGGVAKSVLKAFSENKMELLLGPKLHILMPFLKQFAPFLSKYFLKRQGRRSRL